MGDSPNCIENDEVEEIATEESPNLNITFKNMNSNIQNMTTQIERLFERQSRLDRQSSTSTRVDKRRRERSSSERESKSDPDDPNTSKRTRTNSNNDDTVSLLAHDDLDDDVIQPQRIAQVTDHQGEKNSNLLRTLIDNFDDDDEATGAKRNDGAKNSRSRDS